MAKKRPVGRPPLSSKERLSDAIYVRLTPPERDALDKEARRRGVTASELVRELIRKAGYGPRGRSSAGKHHVADNG
jgi:Ribbon-helix-helix protein, copG family